ncbi:MAG TPA: NAD(+) synthase, partial [Bacteroidales bacterium]|nr:NAD(+) synthase [Bacteroidales bacterium]
EYCNTAKDISDWIRDYSKHAKLTSLVVGLSGGVDSGLVSTLCAMSGVKTFVVTLPCYSPVSSTKSALAHVEWLENQYLNVSHLNIDLTKIYQTFQNTISNLKELNTLALANTKSRLRMTMLYHIATIYNGLVVGTGNKVEDFGIGYFTKYGDGGVDISPLAEFTKSEVISMAKSLGILPEITNAVPCDDLWEDFELPGKSLPDESQFGATYAELERVIEFTEGVSHELTARDIQVLKIYYKLHNSTAHKRNPIPTFRRKNSISAISLDIEP